LLTGPPAAGLGHRAQLSQVRLLNRGSACRQVDAGEGDYRVSRGDCDRAVRTGVEVVVVGRVVRYALHDPDVCVRAVLRVRGEVEALAGDRKSTRLNSSHVKN